MIIIMMISRWNRHKKLQKLNWNRINIFLFPVANLSKFWDMTFEENAHSNIVSHSALFFFVSTLDLSSVSYSPTHPKLSADTLNSAVQLRCCNTPDDRDSSYDNDGVLKEGHKAGMLKMLPPPNSLFTNCRPGPTVLPTSVMPLEVVPLTAAGWKGRKEGKWH